MILDRLPSPKLGEHVSFIGNTGEGKTVTALSLLLDKDYPNYIILNTKHDDDFDNFGETITNDDQILGVVKGGFNYKPSDKFLASKAYKDRFFDWALKAGNRRIYVDEINDICPSAQNYPVMFQKIVKQGRWRGVSMMMTSQELIRCPSFCFSQTQHRYVWFVGWPLHRKLAESWFEQTIPWEQIPERSHRFFLKTPSGVYGPQPRVNIANVNERLQNKNASRASA